MPPILLPTELLINRSSIENLSGITEYSIGFSKFALYVALLYLFFFIFYMGLDSFGYYSFGYTALRLIINVIANSFIAILFGKALAKQLFFR